ncbi:MAG: hypothetical protein HY660_05055 [Armatimonadetes bacterium]|nr:hypothetical protein [Armatimonadota bacterium]
MKSGRDSRWRLRLPRPLRTPIALVALAIIATWIVAGASAPWVARRDPWAQDLSRRLAPPACELWFGYDELGRDV